MRSPLVDGRRKESPGVRAGPVRGRRKAKRKAAKKELRQEVIAGHADEMGHRLPVQSPPRGHRHQLQRGGRRLPILYDTWADAVEEVVEEPRFSISEFRAGALTQKQIDVGEQVIEVQVHPDGRIAKLDRELVWAPKG